MVFYKVVNLQYACFADLVEIYGDIVMWLWRTIVFLCPYDCPFAVDITVCCFCFSRKKQCCFYLCKRRYIFICPAVGSDTAYVFCLRDYIKVAVFYLYRQVFVYSRVAPFFYAVFFLRHIRLLFCFFLGLFFQEVFIAVFVTEIFTVPVIPFYYF